jgi:hypothetical protein
VPRGRILAWLPYAAATRLAEDVFDDVDRLRAIANS